MNCVLQGLIATKRLEDLVTFRVPNEFANPIEPASRLGPLLLSGREPHEREKDMPVGGMFIAILEKAWAIRDAREKKDLSLRSTPLFESDYMS